MSVQGLCARIVGNRWFDRFIISLIILNAIVLGMETSPELMASHGELMFLVNDLVLWVFVAEAALKITAVAPNFRRYFGDG